MPDTGRAAAPDRALSALCAALLALTGFAADGAVPARFHQDAEPRPPLVGLVGTSITDVVWSGRYLWVATERGLARFDPSVGSGLDAEDWVTYTDAHGLGRGSVSALAARGDTVWAATLFDTLRPGDDRSYQVGSGLSWSGDGGASWERIANRALFDTLRPGFEDGPSTPIQNACFGLSVEGDTVWAAFFGGSSVRSTDWGRTWERVLPGGGDQIVFNANLFRARADSLVEAGADADLIARALAQVDSVTNLAFLHRTFSVTAYGDTVWIGTSYGVASSFDFGATWDLHRVRVDDFGEPEPGNLSGNWGLAVERELRPDGGSVIWVGAGLTEGPGQVRAINRSDDDGASWTHSGPTFAWDLAFTGGDTVWAGTDVGLLVSADHGQTWEAVAAADPFTRDELLPSFVGVERFPLLGGQVALWAGADNGLGRSVDGGRTWRLLSFPVKTRTLDGNRLLGELVYPDDGKDLTYAAPSPFVPSRGQRCIIVYSLAADSRVSVDIYDFASRKVRGLVDGVDRAGGRNHREPWDGLDDDGRQVANGVYFFRVETAGGDRAFGNVVVLD